MHTNEQEAIVEFSKKGESFVIPARAGTGKSFILKAIAKARPRINFGYAVFNTKNKDEINADPSKPANMQATTFHSMCYAYARSRFRGIQLEGQKVSKIITKDSDFNSFDKTKSPQEKTFAKENYSAMLELISLMKNSFVTCGFYDVLNLANKYNIFPPMDRGEFINKAMKFLIKSDEDTNTLDFDDMIRFFVLYDLHLNFEGDAFMVDEAQDNTPMRTIIMGRLKEVGTSIIAVGDDRQAIYAFAGADSDSLSNIIKTLNCPTLPLSVNFRCDKNIIKKAQSIVPDIQYHEDKADGVVVSVNYHDFTKQFQPGDVAIGRFNRVIISNCFKYIRDNKPATIQGKDFGNMLKNMIKSFGATDIKDFYARLSTWYERQSEMAEKNGQDLSDAVEDRFQCLKFLADSANTVEEVYNRIDKIFTDVEDGKMFKFSTAHKSKGLEWNRVFVLEADRFRNQNPKMPPSQAIQEANLEYIAWTRAKHELYLIENIEKNEEAA